MDSMYFWIIVGMAAGYVGRMVVPSDGVGAVVGTFIIGIIAGMSGGVLSDNLLGHSYLGLTGGICVAFAGAIGLVTVLRACTPQRATVRS